MIMPAAPQVHCSARRLTGMPAAAGRNLILQATLPRLPAV